MLIYLGKETIMFDMSDNRIIVISVKAAEQGVFFICGTKFVSFKLLCNHFSSFFSSLQLIKQS
jgi:hypothetical protein